MIPDLIRSVDAVQQEYSAFIGAAQHIKFLHERKLMAGDKVRTGNQIGAPDGLGPETQVRCGHGPGLARVIHKIALRIETCVFTKNFDGVFIGAHSAVRTQTVEERTGGFRRLRGEGGIIGNTGMGNIVVNTDSKAPFRLLFAHLVKNTLDHGRSKFAGGKTITTADNAGQHCEGRVAVDRCFRNSSGNIHEQRFACGSGLFGPVKNADHFRCFREGSKKGGCGERTIETHNNGTDFLAFLHEIINGFRCRFRSGTHKHNHPLRIWSADIIKKVILTADYGSKFIHGLLHNGGAGFIKRIAGLAGGKEHVGVLGSTAEHGTIRRHCAHAVGKDQLVINHGTHVGGLQHFNFVFFVGRTETVEVVHEGYPGCQGGCMGNQRHVLGFLDGTGGKHTESGAAGGHDVTVIAENGQRMGRQGTGTYMKYGRGQLACDFKHARNHEQQTLRCRESSCQGSCLQCAMNGCGSAALALHFNYSRHRSPNIGPAFRHPLIRPFSHVRRRGNRVNGCHFAYLVSYICNRFITVHGTHRSGHVFNSNL